MLPPLLQRLRSGIHHATTHSQLLLVLVFAVVLPGLLLVVVLRTLTAADAHVTAAAQQQVATWHDTAALLAAEQIALGDVLTEAVAGDRSLLAMTVFRRENDRLVPILGTGARTEKPIPGDTQTALAFARPGDTLIYPSYTDSARRWVAYRAIVHNDERHLLRTVHDLTAADAVLSAQTLPTYGVLIFAITALVLLALWVNRQVNAAAALRSREAEIAERDAVADTIVHELRAPLTAMRGYASLIEEATESTPAIRTHAARVREGATRLAGVVNEFLEIARIRSGRAEIAAEDIDVAQLIRATLDELRPLATEKQLSIHAQVPEHRVGLYTDPARLQQVLTNLISNAIKYTDTGDISIVLFRTPQTVTIRVEDTGRGMSAAEQSRLFRPYERLGDTESQSAIIGTGLGMWISKQIVEILGGTIGIESIEGVGTHVVVTFPRDVPTGP